jgi:hypothetical protein
MEHFPDQGIIVGTPSWHDVGAYRISLRYGNTRLPHLGWPTGKSLGATACIQRLHNSERVRVSEIAVN